mmetsp:Transcript_4385/g.9576  ORF Transcript_4385/g.9576 Transcript_4385/m.9576 type:complete len:156 (-) Transcript_4385:442-909(-)
MVSAEANGTDISTMPHMFLHARFELPQPAASVGSNDLHSDSGENDSNSDQGGSSIVITKQYFDATNCKTAVLGLPDGVEPIKPEPGDYSYSGMHDQGPLPTPKEGGEFTQIIGIVSAAKKASDEYLTKVIEKEKAIVASKMNVKGGVGQQKRKRN